MPYDRGNMCFASVPKWGLYTPCGKSVLDQDRITVRSLKESVKQGDLVAMEKLAAYYMEGWGIGRPNYSAEALRKRAGNMASSIRMILILGVMTVFTSFGDISPDMEGIADRLEKEGKILLMAVQDETSGLSVYAVDRARYDALPDWDSNAGTDPPFSIGEAIKVARKELVSSCGVEERCIELGTVHFESCTCRTSSHGKTEPVWWFAVIFSVGQNTKSISSGSSRARIETVYVLLDGKVVKPAHMQHADSPDAKRGRTGWRWFWEGMKKGLH